MYLFQTFRDSLTVVFLILQVIFKFVTTHRCTVDAPSSEKDRQTYTVSEYDEMQSSDVRIADESLADAAPRNFQNLWIDRRSIAHEKL